jgi:hypothetical protein
MDVKQDRFLRSFDPAPGVEPNFHPRAVARRLFKASPKKAVLPVTGTVIPDRLMIGFHFHE